MSATASIPPGWEPVRTDDGSWTLCAPGHGQACHSSSGAWREAVERYAEAARLGELAAERGAGVPVRLLDVGTGLGWNLAAARAAVASAGGLLTATCLEREPRLWSAAAELAERCGRGPWSPWFEGTAAQLGGAATDDADAPLAPLELLPGDARASARELVAAGRRFDVVFLDAFSPGVEPDLWSASFLADLAGLLDEGGLLTTYTVSLTVRERLARAGLTVGTGPRVGAKAGGTLAVRGTPRGGPLPPLESRAAAKLKRRLQRAPAPTEDDGS